MSDRSQIEWTDATWNPIRGCSRVSQGCVNCYAESVAARFSGPGQAYEGLIHQKTRGWNGAIGVVEHALTQPLRWRRPRRIFVNSMSDLFHENVPFEFIAAVFFVMSGTTRHTYQVLTKRPQRMLEFFEWAAGDGFGLTPAFADSMINDVGMNHPAVKALGWTPWREGKRHGGYDNCGPSFPYENVWLGVSVENQAAAEERIPLLMQAPAAVRFLSCEPLLGPVDLTRIPWPVDPNTPTCVVERPIDALREDARKLPGWHQQLGLWHRESGWERTYQRPLDWVIVGGESGAGARPFDIAWARSIVEQSRVAGVACFVKQLGALVEDEDCELATTRWDEIEGAFLAKLNDRKGGNPSEWPEDLRVRQFPKAAA